MNEELINEAEGLKHAFVEHVNARSTTHPTKAEESELDEIILDIKMMLYTYDTEMPLTQVSHHFASAKECMRPTAFGKTNAETSDVVVKTLDRFIKHLRRRQGS